MLNYHVAPLAGAWIEMEVPDIMFGWKCPSLPSRERGLKFMVDEEKKGLIEVAPLAGAWIEIRITRIIDTKGRCRSPRGSVD